MLNNQLAETLGLNPDVGLPQPRRAQFPALASQTEEQERESLSWVMLVSDRFSTKERIQNTKTVMHLLRANYSAIFPHPYYDLDEIEKATEAYIHYWGGRRPQALRVCPAGH